MAPLCERGPGGSPHQGQDGEDRVRRVITRIYDLPSFPNVIRKLAALAEDPNSSAKDLASVMAQDQALSAKILKLVNSAFYGLKRPVSSLQHAVSLLGYNSVRSMALSVSVFQMFSGRDEMKEFSFSRFWQHAVAAALGARIVARGGQGIHPDEAFTAGLVHDIGLLLEARYLTKEFAAAVATATENGIPLRVAEIEVLGVDHPLIGGWLAEVWRLPEPIRDAIVYHHDWELDREASDEVRTMTRIVSVVNRLIRTAGWSYEPAGAPDGEEGVEPGELAGADPRLLLEEIASSLDSCRALLGMP